MLYLFCGDDTPKKLEALESFVKKNGKGAEPFSISPNNFDRAQIESLYSGGGLFFTKSLVIFSGGLEREEQREFILGRLKEMQLSESDFVIVENKLLKPVLEIFKKAKAEIFIFELAKERAEKFNSFLLANDFGAKDKLNLWIHFRQAIDRGVAMEELVGILFWKAKDMLTKNSTGRFSKAELENFAGKISYILPEARREGRDAEAALEKFLLDVV
jgi:hypothetical protein